MKKRNIISIVLIAISIGLAVLAYIILPDMVVIQFSLGSSGNTAVPKVLAIIIPTALGIGGAAAEMLSKSDEKSVKKSNLISIVGIGLAIFMIIVNCLSK